ncbi:putative aspartoacylase [Prochlorococcus marinus str. MIT 9515]|uniref:Probable aspartoacylase n=1 Tax=Prochlorococcus marinus (strain MIT 9515) TaxID=167542 RepID=ASPA_PROM5|nr:aspartoacylase [Prochlorococcus marinus]A2BUK0.1 RecName: Full=Probable aspartoacylase [Prochlorococcus marinus str. MIT 9515]ABM71461.1 putative aspartoacylase [Prochlorococcus marinus str. MIT 9515]
MNSGKILIVSSTHGNEINPVWSVNQYSKQGNIIDKNIEYKFIIGNPLAYEKGCRYIDKDLNRSFNLIKNNHDTSIYEIRRANFLVEKFGVNGSEPCDIAIDLHTTTANMGTSIVMYGRREKDFCLAALLQHKFGLPIYLHEKDEKQTGFLVEAWPCGLVIEIGPVAQNFYDPKIINRFLIIISSLREEINKLKNKQKQLPKLVIVHVHQGSIDYPRGEDGNINALIHPKRMNQDWKPIKKGDPLFMDMEGCTKSYNGKNTLWPVFIGEVAYKEKNIAMSYTKKEVINLPTQICEDFFN